MSSAVAPSGCRCAAQRSRLLRQARVEAVPKAFSVPEVHRGMTADEAETQARVWISHSVLTAHPRVSERTVAPTEGEGDHRRGLDVQLISESPPLDGGADLGTARQGEVEVLLEGGRHRSVGLSLT